MSFLLPKVMRKLSAPPSFSSGTGRLNPWLRLGLVFLVLAGIGVGVYGYALHQWHGAQTAVKSGRLDEAQRRLDFCLMIWPRSIPVHLLAARAARLRGDFEGAESHLNRCLKLNHGATEGIQLEFLLLRVQGGEVDEVAGQLLSLYVENNSPESPLILETLARVYMQNLRYGPAFDCLSRWHEAVPDSAEPFRWRGWILERLSDYEGALKQYKQALELDADLVPVRLRLAEMYLQRSDPLAALPHLRAVVETISGSRRRSGAAWGMSFPARADGGVSASP